MNEFNDFNENNDGDMTEPVSGEKNPDPITDQEPSDISQSDLAPNGSGMNTAGNQNGKKLYIPVIILLALIFIMISVLIVYFIYTDIRTGSIEFNKKFANKEKSGFTLELKGNPNKSPYDPNEDGSLTMESLASLVRPQIVEIYAYNGNSSKAKVSCGSGIIISEDGYIITNTHIIENSLSPLPADENEKPNTFVIITSDDKKYDAKVIGRDKKTDIAVVKINASGLPCAELGNSEEVIVGERVAAVGNPEGFIGSVTEGIVSGVNRKIKAESTSFTMNCIQTDAAISSGNSGGALVNMYGQVIGIISSKYITSTSEGLGFAISINDAKPIIEDIISQGYVSGRVKIGITFYSSDSSAAAEEFKEKYKTDIPERLKGLWITAVNDECDISKTELKEGDFILKVAGKKISNYDDLCAAIENKKSGDTLKAECARIDKDMNISYFDIEFKLMEDTSGDF